MTNVVGDSNPPEDFVPTVGAQCPMCDRVTAHLPDGTCSRCGG